MPSRKTVLVYRNELLPSSETFIKEQVLFRPTSGAAWKRKGHSLSTRILEWTRSTRGRSPVR